MSREERELAQIRQISPEASIVVDGGVRAVLLPGFQFRVGSFQKAMDLLLYPGQHGGYVTRLFFRERVDGRGPNWNPAVVAGSQWWAPSWNGVSPELPWTQMLAAHLRALA